MLDQTDGPIMSARMFPLGDVISVATDYQTSPRGMPGTRELLEHMVGHAVMSSQMPDERRRCAPELLRQHPVFASPEFTEYALGELQRAIAHCDAECYGRERRESVVRGWLSGLQSGRYGIWLEAEYPVTPIPVLPKVERKQLSHLDLINRWMPRYICAKCGRDTDSPSYVCKSRDPQGNRCDGKARSLTVEESNVRFAKLVRRILQTDAPSHAGMIANVRTVFFPQGSLHIYGDCVSVNPSSGDRRTRKLEKQVNQMTPEEWLAVLTYGYDYLEAQAESQSKLNKLIAESLVQAQTRPETNPSEGEPDK